MKFHFPSPFVWKWLPGPTSGRLFFCGVMAWWSAVAGTAAAAPDGVEKGNGEGVDKSVAGPGRRPPNIVFFLVDDLGQRDLGCYGSSFYETPHLDRLAAQGMRFTQAYAACPVCSPTRASILTGKYPPRLGITDYIGAPGPEQWKRNTRLLPAESSDRLALQETTLAEGLKKEGLTTAFFAGKWHLGPEGYWPENQGFDFNLGGHGAGAPGGAGKYFTPYGNPRLPDGPPGGHLPDRLADEACRFLENSGGKPFLVYFSFYSVHTPLMGRPDLVEKYKRKRQEAGLQAKWGEEPPRQVRLVQEHVVYAAMVEAMDQAVGKVLDKLEALKLTDDTLVVFTSDNGGLSTSEGSPTSNLPLRAGKGWLYEGGIREPLIARWPGVIQPGKVSEVPVISPDFYPTLMEAVNDGGASGGKQGKEEAGPGTLPGDGVSLLPVLKGGTLAPRPLFWHYPHYGNQGGAPGSAVRQGAWKLIHWAENNRLELYNLEEDPEERLNLASRESGRVEEMRGLLGNWLRSTGARLPTPNPAYNPGGPDGRMPRPPGARRG